jgi:hypothetical protein
MTTRSLWIVIPILLMVVLAYVSGQTTIKWESKPTSINGTWKGNWTDSKGDSGEVSIELKEASGTVTCNWAGRLRIEDGIRVMDTVAWSMKDGKALYTVYGEFQDGGKTLSLQWTLIGPDGNRLRTINGVGILKKQ